MNLRALFQRQTHRQRRETDMNEELRFHREARAADLQRQGLAAAEAVRQAQLEFGSTERYKEECRASLGYRVFDELRADLRYALRGMVRQPAFTVTAILILALATGVNTAFFTLFNNYAIKPLAIHAADRHFDLRALTAQAEPALGWSRDEWLALEEGARAQVAGLYDAGSYIVRAVTPQPRPVTVTTVSANYFTLLGGRVAIGRLPGKEDERQPVAVLTDSGWRKLFDGRPDTIGRTIRVHSTTFTVVGVAQPGFTGTEPVAPDFWVPSAFRHVLRDGPVPAEPRFGLSGMLRPGVSFGQAAEALTAVARRFSRPAATRVDRVQVRPRETVIAHDDEVTPVSAVLFATLLTVLLIACANLANLHLARATSRASEIAMRLSLGASRWRIMRQLLTESLLLALAGSVLGLVCASAALSSLEQYLWSSVAAFGVTILPAGIDWRVFLFAALMAGLAALAFGLLPAYEATATAARRENLVALANARPRRLRGVLIAAQVACSLVLLVFAGILSRSLQLAADPGFHSERIYYLGSERPTRATVDRLRQEPWLASASATNRVPFMSRFTEIHAVVGGQKITAGYSYADENYFETLGVRLRAGRVFTRQEVAIHAKTVVISESTVRRFWPGVSANAALGRTFALERQEDAQVKGVYQVVGVTPNIAGGWIATGDDDTAIYLPAAAGDAAADTLLLRVAGPEAQARARMLALCLEQNIGCEPNSVREMEMLARFPFQAAAGIAAALGGLALLLTAIGLHGVVRYLVVQREKEIGVRIALGAAPGRIVRWILAESGRCVVVGLALGLTVALMLSKVTAANALALQTFDLVVYGVVPPLLGLTAFGACLTPAWRASRVDPMKSLRQE